MIAAIILMLGCHGVTHFLIARHTTVAETVEKAEKVIDFVEQNPVTAFLFKLDGWKYIYTEVLMPGVFVGMYYPIRKRYGYEGAMATALMACMVFLTNFVNDFAYLLSYLVQIKVL